MSGAAGQLAYPRIKALFDAVITVEVNLAGLAAYLRDEKPKYTGLNGRRYFPPIAIIERVTGAPADPRVAAWRAELEKHPPVWFERADDYWDWWATLRDFSNAAKAACIAAGPDLDAGETNPLKRFSTLIRETLLRAEGCTNLRVQHGWNPFRFPDDAPAAMSKAAGELAEWIERLRSLATLEVATTGRESAISATDAKVVPKEPHLRPVHIAILRRLRAVGMAQTREQLWSALKKEHGRDPIREAIDELHEWTLVFGPKGSRKGVSLLDAGRTSLKAWEEAHPETSQKKPGN
jgi:hypothetical protein